VRTRSRRVAAVLILLAASVPAAAASTATPVVYVAEVDGIIHPVSAEFMIHAMEDADRAHAALMVFVLRTPGGLVDSTRDIVSRMLAASTPVAIFVAPAGARAASAGFLLAIAADVTAMAPGTHIGAAHPVSGSGEKMDETVAKKAAEDVAAYARALAARRGRNVQLAGEAVTASKAFTDEEAIAASPPLADIVAPDLTSLLEKLDGRRIVRFDGSAVTLHTAGARTNRIEMTLRQKVLSAIAHPNVAYILLSLGTLGLTIELWSPGAVLPGVVGGLSLLLAFFAFQVLPVNYAGLLLILFGLLLFALEIKVTSFGLLTTGGIVSLLLGSMILIDSPAPEMQLSLRIVLPVVLGLAAISILLIRLGVTAQRQPAVTGEAGMIGESGVVVMAIAPGRPGRVTTHGEIWHAEASEAIPEGSRVRITAIQGLTLTVRRDEVPS